MADPLICIVFIGTLGFLFAGVKDMYPGVFSFLIFKEGFVMLKHDDILLISLLTSFISVVNFYLRETNWCHLQTLIYYVSH